MDETGKGTIENSSFQSSGCVDEYKRHMLCQSAAFGVGLGLLYPKSQKF